MAGQTASKYATTAPIQAFSTQRESLLTDLINDQGISRAHDVRHGVLSPPLAPGRQIYGATGRKDPVDSSGNSGETIASHGFNRHLQGQKPDYELNAAAPAFVPRNGTETYRRHGSYPSETYSSSQPTAQTPLLAHRKSWQHSGAQPLPAAEGYPSIQPYPVAQQASAPGYPFPQYEVPPYIFHQYLMPQYGIQFEPYTPMQRISMFSNPQQAMGYQHYLADRARSYDYTEHQHTLPKPSPSKTEDEENQWQERPAASSQSGSEESEYIGYYFQSNARGRHDHLLSHTKDVPQYLPLIPLEGYYVLGFNTKSSN